MTRSMVETIRSSFKRYYVLIKCVLECSFKKTYKIIIYTYEI